MMQINVLCSFKYINIKPDLKCTYHVDFRVILALSASFEYLCYGSIYGHYKYLNSSSAGIVFN